MTAIPVLRPRPMQPTWRCDRCHDRRLMDQAANTCDRCEQVVCSSCFDATVDRCHECADTYWLSEDDVLDDIHRHPGATYRQVADREREKAVLSARPGEIVPDVRWWVERARALIVDLMAGGYLECRAHIGNRNADVGPLCEWRLADKGREFFRAEVSA